MFVYLFVWETLGIPETPERDHRETSRRPETPQQTNESISGLVHMSLIETHQRETRDTSRNTR